MDVSPKTLREVEFREKMRGYHPEDVDQFLERVAAGIEVLQDRLRQAIERAQRAEQAATEAGGNDDALRRTLLLAQRTADLAVQEAREQAARIVSAAEQQAQSVLGDAEQQVRTLVGDAERRAQSMLADADHRSQNMVSEAEQRARRGHEDTLVEVRADLAKLEVTRQRLQMDVDALTRWLADHRNQLRAALEDAMTRMEQIDMHAPAVSGGSFPPPEGATSPPPLAPMEAPPGPSGPGPVRSNPPPAASGWAPSGPAAAAPPAPGGRPPEESTWQRPEQETPATDDTGDADPYFAELRRAISDNDPLGPRPQDSHGTTGGQVAPGSEGGSAH
jgi:cell division initiation protein